MDHDAASRWQMAQGGLSRAALTLKITGHYF
jgi:hypothetical protein